MAARVDFVAQVERRLTAEIDDLRRRVAALESECNPVSPMVDMAHFACQQQIDFARFERDAARNQLNKIEAVLEAVLQALENRHDMGALAFAEGCGSQVKLSEILDWWRQRKAQDAQSGG